MLSLICVAFFNKAKSGSAWILATFTWILILLMKKLSKYKIDEKLNKYKNLFSKSSEAAFLVDSNVYNFLHFYM
jgi:hypothetical protein